MNLVTMTQPELQLAECAIYRQYVRHLTGCLMCHACDSGVCLKKSISSAAVFTHSVFGIHPLSARP